VKPPLPAARGEVAAVALGGKLHALGGSGGNGNTDQLIAFHLP